MIAPPFPLRNCLLFQAGSCPKQQAVIGKQLFAAQAPLGFLKQQGFADAATGKKHWPGQQH
jgi:hypothetical protein